MISTGRRLLILTYAKHEKRVHVKDNLRVMSDKPRALLESKINPHATLAIEHPSYGLNPTNFGSNMGTGLQLNGIGKHNTYGKLREV